MSDRNTSWAAIALFSAAAAWPGLYGMISAATLSPVERAIYASWCGAAPHTQALVLGHCTACWAGAAALALAGTLTLMVSRRLAPPAVA